MVKKDAEFLKRLLATFRVEAEEHLKAISAGLLDLEKTPAGEAGARIVESVYREVHSLKGAARAVNLTEIESACHSLENALAALKHREIGISPALLDRLHGTVDCIGSLLSPRAAEQAAEVRSSVRQTVQRLESALKEGIPLPGPEEETGIVPQPAVEHKQLQAETIRVSVARLDALLLQAEELLTAKLGTEQHATKLREVLRAFATWRSQWARIQPDVRGIQQALERNGGSGEGTYRLEEQPLAGSQIARTIEFLDWNSSTLKSLERKLVALAGAADRTHRSLSSMVTTLLEDMKKAAMLPFNSLLEVFPKLVRDLARDQGKEVELVVQGGNIEIDRRILEELKDPLVHIVRNCIDHGIEKPEARVQKGKPARGTVTVAVTQQDGGKIEVLVADDGAGIDFEGVGSSALRAGMIFREEAEELDEQEALALIFQSGISTSPIITDISGRGIGLAIVREKIEKIGGAVSAQTHAGRGTSFRLLLPVTLATFRGIQVQAGEQTFVVPAAGVDRVLWARRDAIKTVENKETLPLNGRAVPLVYLDEVLEIPRRSRSPSDSGMVSAFVLGAGDRAIAFGVDAILGEQEILVKTLGRQLSRVRNIAGATVLGDGRVIPILNINDLVKSAVRASAAPGSERIAPLEAPTERKNILVVEDSITARTLLKTIIESVGYQVKTAVDGIDAFTELRSGDYHLVVSDVDMPRMNGFDLTARIRAEKKYSELPVVLVTALDSRQDRERGIDVGADAYIVKSSFDQSNLLEVIRRLI